MKNGAYVGWAFKPTEKTTISITKVGLKAHPTGAE